MTLTTRLDAPDYFGLWQEITRVNSHERESDEGEIAFWARNAEGYERAIAADPDSYRETVAALAGHIRRDDAVLEIGAGTGRFTLPLADLASRVTAVDLSPDMLAILEEKAAGRGGNIHTVRGGWEELELEPHDVVLAAWSLYRMHDVRAGLVKLMNAARRTLLIVDGDFDNRPKNDPPHELLKTEIWGPGDPGVCNYLYFAGMLRQLGARASVQVVTERSCRRGSSPESIAAEYIPAIATSSETNRFTDGLRRHLVRDGTGWRYSPSFAVGVVVWNRPPGFPPVA